MAKPSEQGSGQRDPAVLGALAVAHPNDEALTVDVSRLEREPFSDPEAEGVDRGEGHASDGVANGPENRAYLSAAQNHRQLAGSVDAEQVEDCPVALHGVYEEEAQRMDGDVDAGGSELLLLAEVEEVGAHVV